MNLLLLRPEELAADGTVTVADRRAEHLTRVLHAQPGSIVVAGCLDTSYGQATVVAVQGRTVQLRYLPTTRDASHDEPSRTLLLAVPRPKVLSRCLEHAAALGFTKIALFRSYRVEKSHLHSRKLAQADIAPHLLLGLEQGRRIVMPQVELFERFKPFVEDRLHTWLSTEKRFVAHPSAELPTRALPVAFDDYCLALGPEGGFIPYEVDALRCVGFVPVRAETGPLRVESALSYLTGQLDLLARSAQAPPAHAPK